MRKSTLNIINNSHNHNYLLKKSNFISNNNGGYNLVILSMIILIMGAIMTAVIGYYDISSINRKTRITEDKFEVINIALANYFTRYGKMPCPAPLDCDQNGCNYVTLESNSENSEEETNFECETEECINSISYSKKLGVEYRFRTAIGEHCLADGIGVFKSKNEKGETLLYGNIPAKTLGLDNSYLVDAWGNKMVYIIPESLTQEGALKNIVDNKVYSIDSGEYVKDGEMFLLLSNNVNIQGAYPLDSRENNDFKDTIIVEVENEDGTKSKIEKKVSNLPQKDFSVDLHDEKYLKYSRNLTNFHESLNSNNGGGYGVSDPVCPGGTITLNLNNMYDDFVCTDFEYTGHYETYVVPDNVDSLYIEVTGARGGHIVGYDDKSGNGKGGLGSSLAGWINVKPGEKFYVYVGQRGLDSWEPYRSTPAWNGGGMTASGKNREGADGYTAGNGGGGGATDVRTAVGTSPEDWRTSLDSRIIVAGGGGGASYPRSGFPGTEDGGNGTTQTECYVIIDMKVQPLSLFLNENDNFILRLKDLLEKNELTRDIANSYLNSVEFLEISCEDKVCESDTDCFNKNYITISKDDIRIPNAIRNKYDYFMATTTFSSMPLMGINEKNNIVHSCALGIKFPNIKITLSDKTSIEALQNKIYNSGKCPMGNFFNDQDLCNPEGNYYMTNIFNNMNGVHLSCSAGYAGDQGSTAGRPFTIVNNGLLFVGGPGGMGDTYGVGAKGGGSSHNPYQRYKYWGDSTVYYYDCLLPGGNTFSGGGGYYAGCGTMCLYPKNGKIADGSYVGKQYDTIPGGEAAEAWGNLYDFSCGAGGAGASWISLNFKEITTPKYKLYGNSDGSAKICYQLKDEIKPIMFTTTYNDGQPGTTVYVNDVCPTKVSDGNAKCDDYYTKSISTNNKMALKCGQNGQWEVSEEDPTKLKIYYPCELYSKCTNPRVYFQDKIEGIDNITFEPECDIVNTGKVSINGEATYQCIIDSETQTGGYFPANLSN